MKKDLPGAAARESGQSCREFEWMVGPLVDGELPEAEVAALEGHLRACASCRGLADEFRAFDRLARQAESPPAVSPVEWARIRESLRVEPAVIHVGVSRRIRDWLIPALSLAALALLGAWMAFEVATRNDSPPLPPSARELLVPGSEESLPGAPPAGKRG